jgi:hypothetical protein
VTGPIEPDPPRTRSGLAKLRGGTPAALPAPAVAPNLPTEAMSEPSVGLVDLEKPDQHRAQTPITSPGPLPARGGPGRRGVLITALSLVVAIMALLVVALVNPFDSAQKPTAAAGNGSGGTTDERLAVVRAARQFTVSFFTYDYRKMDTYFRRIEAASSGDFRKDFVSKEKTLSTVVTQLKTVATGQVPDAGAGLFQLNADKATALIAANFNASNAVTKNGQKRYRVRIALQRVKGVWLVTNFDQVV